MMARRRVRLARRVVVADDDARRIGEESGKIHYELQQLPDKLDKLTEAVQELRNVVAAAMANAPEDDADTHR